MSLQEIEGKQIETFGDSHQRSINHGSIGLIYETLQKSQYTKPIESTIRELATNAVDSQREKEIALQIIKGEAKPEDFFIEREGSKYEDSKFNIDYYNRQFLDEDNNNVEIIYKSAPNGSGYIDQLIVRDHGVGIGMPRLEGYFDLGYSSKRNTKALLGAFGLGNKVALSTGVDFYTIVTAHNGKLFKFNCYNRDIQSVLGRYNMSAGTERNSVEFSSGFKAYYDEYSGKNFTEIIVPCKRFNKDKFIQAVKSQLLYFKEIHFSVRDYVTQDLGSEDPADYREKKIHFQANVLYKSDNIVISDNQTYGKPHIIIVRDTNAQDATGVCYGFISFEELEMEELGGAVGFRCPIKSTVELPDGRTEVVQDGVNVTPSRESVIWDDDTRAYIRGIIESARTEAKGIVATSLADEKNLVKWSITVSNLLRNQFQDISVAMNETGRKAFKELAKISDLDNIDPVYGNSDVSYTSVQDALRIFTPRRHTKNGTSKVDRNYVNIGALFSSTYVNGSYPIYTAETMNASFHKDMEVLSENTEFIKIQVPNRGHVWEQAREFGITRFTEEGKSTESVQRALMLNALFRIAKTINNVVAFQPYRHLGEVLEKKAIPFNDVVDGLLIAVNHLWTDFNELYRSLNGSGFKKYEEIEVTKERQEEIDKMLQQEEEKEEELKKSMAELRAEREEMLYHSPYFSDSYNYGTYNITFTKKTIKTRDATNPLMFGSPDVIYGFEEDRETLGWAYGLNKAYNQNNIGSEAFVRYRNNLHKEAFYNDPNKIPQNILDQVKESQAELDTVVKAPSFKGVFPKVIKIAQPLKKHYEANPHFHHVDDFLYPSAFMTTFYGNRGRSKEEVATANPLIIKMLTAKFLKSKLEKYKSAGILEEVAPEIYAIYDELSSFVNANSEFSRGNPGIYGDNDFNMYLDRLSELQLKIFDLDERAVRENLTREEYNEELARFSKEITNVEDFGKVYVLDYELVKKFRILETWLEDDGLRAILTAIRSYINTAGTKLVSGDNPLLVQEVRSILSHKGMDDFDIEKVRKQSQIKYQLQ